MNEIGPLDHLWERTIPSKVREAELLKLLLGLYHQEVDAHSNVEQFLKENYEGRYSIAKEKIAV